MINRTLNHECEQTLVAEANGLPDPSQFVTSPCQAANLRALPEHNEVFTRLAEIHTASINHAVNSWTEGLP